MWEIISEWILSVTFKPFPSNTATDNKRILHDQCYKDGLWSSNQYLYFELGQLFRVYITDYVNFIFNTM